MTDAADRDMIRTLHVVQKVSTRTLARIFGIRRARIESIVGAPPASLPPEAGAPTRSSADPARDPASRPVVQPTRSPIPLDAGEAASGAGASPVANPAVPPPPRDRPVPHCRQSVGTPDIANPEAVGDQGSERCAEEDEPEATSAPPATLHRTNGAPCAGRPDFLAPRAGRAAELAAIDAAVAAGRVTRCPTAYAAPINGAARLRVPVAEDTRSPRERAAASHSRMVAEALARKRRWAWR